MAGLLSLLTVIAKHGSFKTPATDFAFLQKSQLAGFEKFLPNQSLPEKPLPHKNLIVHQFKSTGAHLKSSLRQQGGHLVAPEKKLFYVRIPKAANTSCSFALLKINFPDLPKTITSTQVNLITDCWLEDKVGPALKTLTGFTVVRHPLHRLVSVYRDFFERNDSDFIYNDYLFGILPKSLSFDEFVYRISKIPDRLKDQHFRPQRQFVASYLKRKIPVKIFKLEKPEALQKFLSAYGLEFPHLNQTPPYDYRVYYSGSTLKIARNMYASDFALFNYDQ
ncbi:MAG: sulfotransferase family 2 domain-containing protein [Flammeovirgaceae bacterium]|nr:MAG: sulfotransferase family 2 domain-containing protein [Flammeovirgaceae bacterium]